MQARIVRASRVGGSTAAPGDKSISHRALILSALAEGSCELVNLAPGADVRSTARCLSALGAEIELGSGRATVRGQGLLGLTRTPALLDCGNSGTTMRLLCGVVAGARITAGLDGDASLRRRPMRRVLEPLRQMGAKAVGAQANFEETAPLHFSENAGLTGMRHELRIASAQVKSCLLLAGLWADGRTTVREPQLSRDHTERMLRAFGAPLEIGPDGAVSVEKPRSPLRAPVRLEVPGDPSSAAFLVAAALMAGSGEVEIQGVDVNPTRTGFLRVIERMGGQVERIPEPDRAGDPVATLRVRGGTELTATDVSSAEIPALIDEVPLLSVLATRAYGLTTIRGAGELRFKESDRIAQMAQGLTAMGADLQELEDGLAIRGPSKLRGAHIDSRDDHRIAMSFAIAGLVADGPTTIAGAEWADISFPGFFQLLSRLTGGAVSLGNPGSGVA